MNRLYQEVTARLHYVFVNNDRRHQTHADGALYLGPRCVFLKAQNLQGKIECTLLYRTGWGKSLHDRVVDLTSSLCSRFASIIVRQPKAAAVYIKRFAISNSGIPENR